MRMLDASGRILVTLVPAPAETGWFGDGSDGAVSFDTTPTVLGVSWNAGTNSYTLNRSIFCTNLTIGKADGSTVIVKTAGYKVFCTGILTILNGGKLINDGNSTSNQTGGVVLAAAELGGGTAGGNGGNAGGNGVNGTNNSSNPTMGGTGGAGGASTGTPGTGGPNALLRPVRYLTQHLLSGSTILTGGSGGGGGGGGTAVVGGGGGGGGGVLMVFANSILIDTLGATGGLISAKGGNGAAGTNGSGTNANGAGGGGGGGGVVYLCYYSLLGASKLSAAGGSFGLAGTGGSGGGAPGAAGTNGVILRYNMQTRSWES